MYNAEYYDGRRASFENTYNNFVSSDTAARTAVLESLRLQEAADERAYADNEDLDKFTAVADSMEIDSIEAFDYYLSRCLGGNLRSGVYHLKQNPDAFFTSSLALSEQKHEAGISVAVPTEERVLWKEKHITKRTWSRTEGFKQTEAIVRTPMTKSQIKRKSLALRIFPERKNVEIKDRKFPFYPIISVILCMVVFIFPVFLSIMNNEVAIQNKENDAYIRELNAEISGLRDDLAQKNDMELINRLAREEYGMIDVELSETHVMNGIKDTVVLADKSEEELPDILVALLSAIGIIGED